MMRPALLLAVFGVLATVGACASAEKSFEKAREAESQSRFEEAADLYLDALRRDPGYPGAREGARVAGGRAIDHALAVAGELEKSGRLDAAALEFQRIENLVARAAAVRVALALPGDYAARRGRVHVAAVEARLREADALAQGGRHEAAAAAYDRADRGLEPTPEQRARARSGRLGALLIAAQSALGAGEWERAGSLADAAVAVYGEGAPESAEARDFRERARDAWFRGLLAEAEALRAEGRFQGAFARANRALSVHGAAAAGSADAHALIERIVAEGTQHVAVLPIWRHERVRELPPGLVDAINDAVDGQWEAPPAFQAALDPRVVREELRRAGLDRMALTEQQARAVGQALDADFVVLTHVTGCRYDRGESPRRQVVKTQAGETAELLVYSRRSIVLQCAFRIVRVADRGSAVGGTVANGTVEADAVRPYRHAECDGDTRGLLLTQEQHRLLDRRALAEIDRAIEREAAEGVAKGLFEAARHEIATRLP